MGGRKEKARGRCSYAVRQIFEDTKVSPPKERLTTAFVIMVVVILNSGVDAWAGANAIEGSRKFEVKTQINICCLVFYTIEMLLKMFAFGLVAKPDGFFRRPWCWLDFIVVVSSIAVMALVANGSSGQNVQFLRVII